MEPSLEVTNVKESTDSAITRRLTIPNEIEIVSIKKESDCLDQSEIYIKEEPHEDDSEFLEVAGTSNDMWTNSDEEIKIDEPMIKIECDDMFGALVKDPLDVDSQYKVAVKKDHSSSELDETIEGNEGSDEKEDYFLSDDEFETAKNEQSSSKNQLPGKKKQTRRKHKNRYTCNVCQKMFPRKSDIDIHLRIHTGEKPFKCEICEKTFTQLGNLSIHMISHSDKPYSCDICFKSFGHKCDLGKHKLTHSIARPYSCTGCNKTFRRKIELVRHERTHTGVKPFPCDMCEKSFSQKTTLIQHKRMHTGEKPYSCNICNKSFAQKIGLTYHIKTHKQ